MKPSSTYRHIAAHLFMLLSACTPHVRDLSDVADDLEHRTGQRFAEPRAAVPNETEADEIMWPPNVSIADGLSEDELVSLALCNNTAFRTVLADLGLSRADLVQAGMLPNPTFSMLVPWGAKPLELTVRYPLEIFWLRPQRLDLARLDVEQTAERLVQNGLDLIRDVRIAYAESVLAEETLKLSESSLKLNQTIAELTLARLHAGDATELEAANARIDALQTQEQLKRLQHDARVARERLRNLVGLSLGHWPETLAPEPLPIDEAFDPERLLADALETRPDLLAARINVEAAGQGIGLARVQIFDFVASLNAKGIDGNFLAGPGLDVTLPVLNQNQGGIAQAQARFDQAARQYAATRQRIALEIREAHIRLQQAGTSSTQWQTILPPLETNLQDAERAYRNGNVTYLFVLESQRRWLDARLKAVQADADLRRARAELERSVGQRLPVPTDNTSSQTGRL